MDKLKTIFENLHAAEAKDFKNSNLPASESSLAKAARENKAAFNNLIIARLNLKDVIDDNEKKDTELINKHIATERNNYINRSPVTSSASKKVISDINAKTNLTKIPLIGETIYSETENKIVGFTDIAANVSPDDASQINLVAKASDGGAGCYAPGRTDRKSKVLWYSFIPDKTALWYLRTTIDFHGFYTLIAYDHWYNCKHTYASVLLTISSWQFDRWVDTNSRYPLNKHEQNIHTTKFFDSLQSIDLLTNLRGNDRVWVRLKIEIAAIAQGSSSYSEVNFSDGNSNYIQPYDLVTTALS